MKKLILAALAALPLLAASARADGCGPFCGCWFPTGIEAGGNLYLRLKGPQDGPGGAQCGPWYLYWPLEAHFQTPANPAYPYWPAPMTLPVRTAVGVPGPGNFQPASYLASPYGASRRAIGRGKGRPKE